jgi:glycosyltransferase involved in cell wall biosynthesis
MPGGGFLFGVFGHLRESKRLVAALEAYARVCRRYPAARLLIAGDFVSRDLPRAIAPLLRQPGVIRIPYLSERDFWRHAGAIDACINLRYPAAGETSGIAIRFMGLGKTVLVSAGQETAAYPEDACIRVDTGLPEREMLEAYMLWLCQTPAAALTIGARAAAHIRERHAAPVVARQFRLALQSLSPELRV